MSDLSELFSRESARLLEAGADAVVIAMQEVDANTSRRPDDVPAHLTRDLQQTLRPTFAHRFLPAITLCPRGAPDWCIANPDQGARPEGCNACRGSFGVALIASDPFVEVREDRLAWYGRDAFDAAGARASRDFREHGMEPRVALAGRVRSAAGDLWVVSVHLGGEVAPSTPDEQIAVRHVAEVLEFVRSSLGTSVPVLVVGDFNLLRRGQHRTGDPRYASNGAGYEAMRNRFTEAGFVELGDTGSEPCWEVDRCTITPWGRYSAVDYAWLQDPSGRVRDARVDVVSPELAPGCFLTDHMMLRVELQLHSPGVDGE